jgi:hypothetical protein
MAVLSWSSSPEGDSNEEMWEEELGGCMSLVSKGEGRLPLCS